MKKAAAMDNTHLLPDPVGEAEVLVTQQKAKLDAARARARAEVRARLSPDDWLADRQDLLQLQELIRNYSQRESRLAKARRDYEVACKQYQAEKAKRPNWVPLETLDWKLSWLPSNRSAGVGEKSAGGRDPEGTLQCDIERELHSLREAVEAAQAAFLESERAIGRQREIHDYVTRRIEAFVNEHTREEQTAYNAALARCEEARRDCEAQQRAWWAAIKTHPIATVVKQLPSVPAEHIEAVMRRLLDLPATDPHVHHEDVHRFLLANRNFVRGLDASAPVVIASIGRLVATGADETARALLDLCPAADSSPLGGLVAYLRYVLHKAPDLSGVTEYRTLTANDLFLGACYYEGKAEATLQEQSQWEYKSLVSSLRAGWKDARDLHDFKVRGLQPRIAELAFREVFGRLHGAAAAQRLRDLNAELVASIPPPLSLVPRPKLPSADWADGVVQRYDVKCNLFYPRRGFRKRAGLG